MPPGGTNTSRASRPLTASNSPREATTPTRLLLASAKPADNVDLFGSDEEDEYKTYLKFFFKQKKHSKINMATSKLMNNCPFHSIESNEKITKKIDETATQIKNTNKLCLGMVQNEIPLTVKYFERVEMSMKEIDKMIKSLKVESENFCSECENKKKIINEIDQFVSEFLKKKFF